MNKSLFSISALIAYLCPMPLYKEWNPDLHSLAAIWQITETEDFFSAQLPVSGLHIAHPKRRIEFLAGRFLLQYLNKDFPLHDIVPDEHDKPQLPGQEFHFSIAHSFPYVACMVSARSAVGIDIQCWHQSILSIRHKFLSEKEQAFCGNDAQQVTLAWCAKEAAYKYQGRRGVDFIGHLPIQSWDTDHGITDIKINLKLTEPFRLLPLKGFIFPDFALSTTHNSHLV